MKLELKEVYEDVARKSGISKKDVELAFRSVFGAT